MRKKYTADGKEIPVKGRVEVPLRFKRPPSFDEQVRSLIRGEFSRQAAAEGRETFEESQDFEVGDSEPEVFSQYEMVEMQEDTPAFRSAKQVLTDFHKGGILAVQAGYKGPVITNPKESGNGEVVQVHETSAAAAVSRS